MEPRDDYIDAGHYMKGSFHLPMRFKDLGVGYQGLKSALNECLGLVIEVVGFRKSLFPKLFGCCVGVKNFQVPFQFH